MKTLILITLFLFPAIAGGDVITDEAKDLRNAFIRATNEYKATLGRLRNLQLDKVKKSEQRLKQSEQLRSENLIPQLQVDENQQKLAADRANLADTNQRIAEADQQLAAVADEAKFIQEYKRAARARKRSRKPCDNWDIAISQRQTAKSATLTYKIVCR